MVNRIAKEMMSERRFPPEVPMTLRGFLLIIGEPDDVWRYIEPEKCGQYLHHKFIISTSGILVSLISQSVIGISKNNPRINLVGKTLSLSA
jgi:hypothetical protein